MNTNGKADAVNIGSNQNQYITGGNKRLNAFQYRANRDSFQCKRCGSDYGRFASPDGFCQDCQQRVEFIRREHPQIINQVRREAVRV